MIIKFIKEHEVGISKGTVTNVNETIALKFIANGYAEESDLKTLEDFQRAIHKDKLKIAKASMKSAEKNPYFLWLSQASPLPASHQQRFL